MSRVIYKVVEHDGGWAYKVGEVYSETFPTHDEAHDAAVRVAAEQRRPGDDVTIEFQDGTGKWRTETDPGSDRPDTEVDD